MIPETPFLYFLFSSYDKWALDVPNVHGGFRGQRAQIGGVLLKMQGLWEVQEGSWMGLGGVLENRVGMLAPQGLLE